MDDKDKAKAVVPLIMMTSFIMFSPAISNSFPVEYDPRLMVLDQSLSRLIAGASLVISGISMNLTTGIDGSVMLNLVPAGSMEIVVAWKSVYNPEPVTIARSAITIDRMLDIFIISTVYDIELQLITPKGNPIMNAEVWLADVLLGKTDANGKVYATQVPSLYTPTHRSYPVKAKWLGVDMGIGEINVTHTGTYVFTAKNVATLTVQVIGAHRQGLSAANIEIKTSDGKIVYSGISNEQGIVGVEVPYGTYSISVNYKGFTNTALATVSTPEGTVQIVSTDVFAEIFGMAMTFATFILWLISALIVVLILVIAIHEYHIYRRKKLPQLFGVRSA
ncbi:MAG: hypothetical protein ACUVTL_07815 [Thermoproteota archaeon]